MLIHQCWPPSEGKKKKILEVEFTGGGIYEYYDVVKKTYDELMNADSHGSYFYHNIRDDYDYSLIRRRK